MIGSFWSLLVLLNTVQLLDDDMSDDLACDESHRMVLMYYDRLIIHVSSLHCGIAFYTQYKPKYFTRKSFPPKPMIAVPFNECNPIAPIAPC